MKATAKYVPDTVVSFNLDTAYQVIFEHLHWSINNLGGKTPNAKLQACGSLSVILQTLTDRDFILNFREIEFLQDVIREIF